MEEDNLKTTKQKNKTKTLKSIGIVLLVILAILVMLLGIGIGIIANKIGKINYDELDKTQLGINDNLYNEVSNNVTQKEFENIKNVALFGVDGGRSDTIIIASINQNNHTIKLLSIPRDTYVSVEKYGKTKINHAYAYGKEQLALKTLNSNFGLNISEYVTVNFKGLINVINKIGGITLNITKAEMEYINQYVHESYQLTGKNIKLLSSYGNIKLTGEQALTHARNRTVGNDFDRAERQRDVITAMMNTVTKKSINEIWSLSDSILKEIKTNLDVAECMDIMTGVLGNTSQYLNNITSEQIPSEENADAKGQYISEMYYYVCDLEKAKEAFKNTIYGE